MMLYCSANYLNTKKGTITIDWEVEININDPPTFRVIVSLPTFSLSFFTAGSRNGVISKGACKLTTLEISEDQRHTRQVLD